MSLFLLPQLAAVVGFRDIQRDVVRFEGPAIANTPAPACGGTWCDFGDFWCDFGSFFHLQEKRFIFAKPGCHAKYACCSPDNNR